MNGFKDIIENILQIIKQYRWNLSPIKPVLLSSIELTVKATFDCNSARGMLKKLFNCKKLLAIVEAVALNTG